MQRQQQPSPTSPPHPQEHLLLQAYLLVLVPLVHPVLYLFLVLAFPTDWPLCQVGL
jgi:hypothetical protein